MLTRSSLTISFKISRLNFAGLNYNVQLRRNFGIGDKILSYATNKLDSSKEQQFQAMVDYMLSVPNWTPRLWKATLEKQLGSWMLYIPGASASDEVKTVKLFKEMLESLTPAELDNADLINGVARERIARQSNKSVDDVSKMVFFFRQSRVMATWLHMKKKACEPLPTTEFELQSMQEEDQRIRSITAKIFNPGGQKRGRGQKSPF